MLSPLLPIKEKGFKRQSQIWNVDSWLRRWCLAVKFRFLNSGLRHSKDKLLARDGTYLKILKWIDNLINTGIPSNEAVRTNSGLLILLSILHMSPRFATENQPKTPEALLDSSDPTKSYPLVTPCSHHMTSPLFVLMFFDNILYFAS